MHFAPGTLVSIVPLTNGKFQLSYIDKKHISWLEDFDNREELQIMCDMKKLKVIPYIKLITLCCQKK